VMIARQMRRYQNRLRIRDCTACEVSFFAISPNVSAHSAVISVKPPALAYKHMGISL
jgi:hypothetical protein